MNNQVTILLVLIGFISSTQAMVSKPTLHELQQIESRFKKIRESALDASRDAIPNTRLKVEADFAIENGQIIIWIQYHHLEVKLLKSKAVKKNEYY